MRARVLRLSLYSLVMGVGAGCTVTYLPLYGFERLGFSETKSGLVAATIGVAGAVARIIWGHLAERIASTDRSFFILTTTGAAGVWMAASAPSFGASALWPATILVSLSVIAWNSVGMLAVVNHSDHSDIGRDSGFVVFGFLAGFTVGPLVFGASVDSSGYTVPWLVLGALLAIAGTVGLSTGRR